MAGIKSPLSQQEASNTARLENLQSCVPTTERELLFLCVQQKLP